MDLYEIVLGLEKQRIRQALTGRLMPWYWCFPALMSGIWASCTFESRLLTMVVSADGYGIVPTLGFWGWLFALICVCVCLPLTCRVRSLQRRMRLGMCVWCLGWGLLGYMAASPMPKVLAPVDVSCAVTAKAVTGRLPGETAVVVEVSDWACDNGTSNHGRFLARMSVHEGETVERGETFRTVGRFQKPVSADTPGAFDAESQMRNRGISLLFRRTRHVGQDKTSQSALVRVDKDHQHLRRAIDRLRLEAYDALRPYSAYGILPALSLGVSKTLDKETRKTFAELGIAHVLAVSGLHFGLIAAALTWLISRMIGHIPWILRRWGRKRATAFLSVLLLWLYILVVGAPVSAQRAMLMMYACMIGRLCGRKPESLRNLSLAGLIILILDPRALFSPGFQLSFLAVLGIFCTYDLLQVPMTQWFQKHIQHSALRRWLNRTASVLVMTLGATLVTAPASIWHFGQLPLLGMLTNLVAIPFVSFLMLPLSLCATLFRDCGEVGIFLGTVAGQTESVFVQGMLWAAAHIPCVHVRLQPHPVVMFVFSMVAAMTVLANRPTLWRRYLERATAVAASVVIVISLVSPAFWFSSSDLRLTFIAMGQADATLVEFPDGTKMLVDAGNAIGSTFDMGTARILPYLQFLGIEHLDYVVLTHPDYDHYAAIESVLKEVSVGAFWFNGEHAQEPAYHQMLHALMNKKIPVVDIRHVPAKQAFGKASVTRLWPENVPEGISRNDQSIVLQLQYGQFSALLMGDAGFEVEERLIARYGEQLDSTLLKAGHHGSRYATGEAWLDVTEPQFVIFSAGPNNRYHFPAHETTQRCSAAGAHMLGTHENGTIRVMSDGRTAKVQTAW